MDCKTALTASAGNFEKAYTWLRQKGLSTAAKKADRKAMEGLITSYIHSNYRVGVLLEVNSETDFVARNENFKVFVKDLSLHIAAMNPLYIKTEDIPDDTVQQEKKVFEKQALLKSDKTHIVSRIAEGFYKKWLQEVCLLEQEFVRRQDANKQTVGQALNDLIARMGENVVIRRFVRFALGEENTNTVQ